MALTEADRRFLIKARDAGLSQEEGVAALKEQKKKRSPLFSAVASNVPAGAFDLAGKVPIEVPSAVPQEAPKKQMSQAEATELLTKHLKERGLNESSPVFQKSLENIKRDFPKFADTELRQGKIPEKGIIGRFQEGVESEVEQRADTIAESRRLFQEGKISEEEFEGVMTRSALSGFIAAPFQGVVEAVSPVVDPILEKAVIPALEASVGTLEFLTDPIQPLVDKVIGRDNEIARSIDKLEERYKADEVFKNKVDSFLQLGEAGIDLADMIALAGIGKKAITTSAKTAKAAPEIAKQVVEKAKPVAVKVKDVGLKAGEFLTQVRQKVQAKISPEKVAPVVDDVVPAAAPVKAAQVADTATLKALFKDIDRSSTDLTFRAIKPRITKKQNLKTVKQNMGLANKTIVEEGFIPTNVTEYADAIAGSKKQIWSQIEAKLKAAGSDSKVDLAPIAIKILDMADDPALLRTNPSASKQLVKYAENLVDISDEVSVLEAEKIKQLLNAELEGLFGELNISKPLKEAKKLTTREIGLQLDEVLSDVPGEFRSLKLKYGALSSIEDDVVKRMIVFERQSPVSFLEGFSRIEAAVELFSGRPLAAGKRLLSASLVKKLNDANLMVEKAFKRLGKDKPSKPFKTGEVPPTKKSGGTFLKKIGEDAFKVGDLTKEKAALPKRKIEPDLTLKGEDAIVQKNSIGLYGKDRDVLLDKYFSKHGDKLNTDSARPLFEEAGYRGYNAAAVHEASSALLKDVEDIVLNSSPKELVMMYAGGSGTGKSSVLGTYMTNIDDFIIKDGNLSSFPKALEFLKKVNDTGRRATIAYVYRDMVDSFVNGVVTRMAGNVKEVGRIVPINIHIKNHLGSLETIKKLVKHFKGTKQGKRIVQFDNSLGLGKQQAMTIDQLMKLEYVDVPSMKKQMRAHIDELLKKGQINEKQHKAYIHE